MKTSDNGITLIKQFEGVRLTAYKPVAEEQYYTIGYGHYGPDVYRGMKITQLQAENLLREDLVRYENSVLKTVKIPLTQNQFDALVSFTYNCGAGSLQKLVAGRTAAQIADKLLAYVYGSGKKLPGLVKRRNAERALFLKPDTNKNTGGLTMDQYTELKQMIAILQTAVNTLSPTYYDWTTACPEWAIPYVQIALDKGIIKGDEQGRLRLTDDKISNLVVTMRATGIME